MIGVGPRTLLAMTCWRCGELRDGSEFMRYRRKKGERCQYITRRCRHCHWQPMALSYGR